MNKKIYGLAMGAMALSFMASCSNDVNNDGPKDPANGDALTMKVAKDPKVVIWTGNGTLAGTRAEEEETNKANQGTNKYDQKEVEINLSIQDVHQLQNGKSKYDVEDLVSHLSIHARAAVETITVTLPVPAKYYCDQDDLYIYGSRMDGILDSFEFPVEDAPQFDFDSNETTTTIADQEVKVKVDFFAPIEGATTTTENSKKDGYITVTVSGITQAVLDACKKDYADGINFDIYNYYNRASQYTTGGAAYAVWTVEGMKEALDKSEVEFENVNKDSEKTILDYYINAFTRNGVGGDPITVKGTNQGAQEVLRDCKVALSTKDAALFYDAVNGSTNVDALNYYNMVYLNKTAFPYAEVGEKNKYVAPKED